MQILVLLTGLFVCSMGAAAPASKTVQAARQLILKKDRSGALLILMEAAEKEKSKPKVHAEIIKEIDRLSKVFLTEDGQKNFELAESILYANKPGSVEKYEQALTVEDQNAQVLLGLTRAHLSEGNCTAAQTALMQLEKVNPFLPEKKILKLKTAICLKQPELTVENDPAFKGEFKNDFRLTQAEMFMSQQKIKEADDTLKNITDEKMPEVAYWQFKANEENPSVAATYAEKYVDLCKTVGTVERREYKLEPLLCRRIEEAETFIKKNEASK